MKERQTELTSRSGYKYLLYTPDDFEKKDQWPLIIFLHGAGERGSILSQIKRNGLPSRLDSLSNFPFLVASPQCPSHSYWDIESLRDFAEEAINMEKVDKRRVYLTGISMGGYGTWMLGTNNPGYFAAIAPVCGGGDPAQAHFLKDTPVWAFHGAKDRIVPISETEQMVRKLKEVGGNVKFTVYPDAEHDSWTETYQNEELYHWFLTHSSK